jgi:hypothetical protein
MLRRTSEGFLANEIDEQCETAVGLLADLGTVPILLHDIYCGLEIDIQTAVTGSPFDIRFSLRNPNVLFAVNKLEVVCTHRQVVVEGERIGEGYSARRLHTPATIEAGATVHVACQLTPGAAVYETAEMQIHVNCRMIFWPRSKTEYFTWTKGAHQWGRGELRSPGLRELPKTPTPRRMNIGIRA